MNNGHPIRVLHCVAGNLYGGIETLLATLARARALAPGMGPEFALCFEGRLSEELRGAGVPVHMTGPARFSRPWTVWGSRRSLGRVLATRSLDVVVTHGCWPHLLFGPVARRSGKPLVYWMHDRINGDQWVERVAARTLPDLTLVNSRGTAETLPKLFPNGPSDVLYYPVSPPRPSGNRAKTRNALGASDETTVILQTSRMEPWKGHALLIAALGRLRAKAGWSAWIAGGAQRPHERAYLASLQAAVGTAGIGDRVRFLGDRADVPDLLAAADVHCQPNTGPEPFGIAFVEALYARLPLVSTRMGGAAEIVDESCGLLVPPADPTALAEALARLIDEPETRDRLGAAGPERARLLCDPAAALGRLEGLLRRVCS